MNTFRTVGMFLCAALLGCSGPSRTRDASTTSESYEVAEAALQYMLDGPNGSAGSEDEISAQVLRAGPYTRRLVAAFSGYKPRVTDAVNVSRDANGRDIDEATGRPVVIWSVTVGEVRGNRATAYIGCSLSNIAASARTLYLRRSGGRWLISGEEVRWAS
jgi:hypothetical protein